MVNTHSTSTIYIYKYECVAVTEDAPNFPYVYHSQYKRISVIVLIMVGKIWKISCIRLLHDHCTHHLNRDDDTQAPFGIYMQFLSMLLEPKKEVQHRILKGKISELGHVVKVRLSCIFFFYFSSFSHASLQSILLQPTHSNSGGKMLYLAFCESSLSGLFMFENFQFHFRLRLRQVCNSNVHKYVHTIDVFIYILKL